jgi:hypothetical protein
MRFPIFKIEKEVLKAQKEKDALKRHFLFLSALDI